jgi:hypothetical protein
VKRELAVQPQPQQHPIAPRNRSGKCTQGPVLEAPLHCDCGAAAAFQVQSIDGEDTAVLVENRKLIEINVTVG